MEKNTTRVRDIIIDENYISYFHKQTRMCDYMTSNPLLYQILTARGVSPFNYDGRLRLQTQAEKQHFTCRIHDLAYACYHHFIRSEDTWQEDLQRYLDWKNAEGVQIDHCDGNPHNNTVNNLSLMPCSLNGSKGAITFKFLKPVILNTAYVDNEYRVQIIWTGMGQLTMNFVCREATDFVDCLKSLSVIDPEWYKPLKIGSKWQNTVGECLTRDIRHSLAAQQRLAEMPREAFDEYMEGGLTECLRITSLAKAVLMLERKG